MITAHNTVDRDEFLFLKKKIENEKTFKLRLLMELFMW